MALTPQQEFDQKQARLLAARWAVGFRDRGHGHGDFAVVTEANELVVECPSHSLAGHIVSVHNNHLDSLT